ncbi:hypothetical protein MPH_12924 [Macrophomina phaseolina MS6]|uniref:Protein kinase domain-containing protein n=1 Tax=Macrophomina phaseolina (strain MS6) TaxID=1126212 RepID=K2RAP3_MACPH|nr:hypothetical protein MPH_12924 [Macrophomina phaseolina MS6]
MRDIKRLKALDYQHIIAVVGTYQAANEYRILMSPVGEQNLEAFLIQLNSGGDKQYQQHKTWLHGWFSCIASALLYIHDNGLLHREIEPKNIIHRGSEVYFTDFGLRSSTALYAQTTTAYSAPETERPESQHTQRSDIFSLGCVYLEMLIARDSRSVKEFRVHYQDSVDFSETGLFRYHSALPKIKELLSYRCFNDQNHCDSWGRTILPMLNLDQRARPYTDEVLRRLQTKDLLPPASGRFCTCQSGGATNSPESLDIADPRQSPERPSNHLAKYGEIPDEIVFFTVRNETTENFQVDLVQPARCQPWSALEIVSSFEHKSHMFQVGDLVWIRLTGEPDALAEIVEAKAVGDGTSRILIRIF